MDIIEKAAKAAFDTYHKPMGINFQPTPWHLQREHIRSGWTEAVNAAVAVLLYDQGDVRVAELTDADRQEVKEWAKRVDRSVETDVVVSREMMRKIKLVMIECDSNLGETLIGRDYRFVRLPIGDVRLRRTLVSIDDGPAGQKPVPPAGEEDGCTVVRSGE